MLKAGGPEPPARLPVGLSNPSRYVLRCLHVSNLEVNQACAESLLHPLQVVRTSSRLQPDLLKIENYVITSAAAVRQSTLSQPRISGPLKVASLRRNYTIFRTRPTFPAVNLRHLHPPGQLPDVIFGMAAANNVDLCRRTYPNADLKARNRGNTKEATMKTVQPDRFSAAVEIPLNSSDKSLHPSLGRTHLTIIKYLPSRPRLSFSPSLVVVTETPSGEKAPDDNFVDASSRCSQANGSRAKGWSNNDATLLCGFKVSTLRPGIEQRDAHHPARGLVICARQPIRHHLACRKDVLGSVPPQAFVQDDLRTSAHQSRLRRSSWFSYVLGPISTAGYANESHRGRLHLLLPAAMGSKKRSPTLNRAGAVNTLIAH